MSKTNDTPTQFDEDDLLPEYDFSKGVRGKHHQAYLQGHSLTISHRDGTTTTQYFPSLRIITKIPGVCGGAACIAGTRIAVWLLVEAQQLGISEAQLLQDYPHITAADLVNAWSYADAYPKEIAAAICVNNEA
jgi:uncharacterized protein (DUF433 family)